MPPASGKTILRAAVAALAAGVLFCAYSFLPLTAPALSASPDENANRFFAAMFADSGTLWAVEPLNFIAPGMVHPRSIRVVDDLLVPGGFLGLPVLYGGIASVAGKAVLPYLTPIFAILAVMVWGLLVARFFGSRIGVAAAALLAFQPIWWYETARTLQPNVLFASLTIFAAFFLFASPFARAHAQGKGSRLFKHADAALSGALLALALAVRMSEAYWFALAALIIAACMRFRLSWKRLAIFAATGALMLAPFLLLNQTIYGSPLATGYGSAVDVPVAELPHGKGAALIGPLQPVLFPLGFAPREATGHFAGFGIGITWWWSMLVACALAALALEAWRVRKAGAKIAPETLIFGAVALSVSVWLILFYGSWTIRDNPDPNAVTIGSSYLRYWLPIYVFSTVPVAWLAVRASSTLGRRAGTAALAGFLALAACAGAVETFWSPQEGLAAVRASLIESDIKKKEIVAATPGHALIVVDRADKYLFPERRVMLRLRSEATYAAIGLLEHAVPIYYFGITFPEADLTWLREDKLPPLGLTIEPVLTLGEETLYRFDKHPEAKQ